jgi:hypothetical protein
MLFCFRFDFHFFISDLPPPPDRNRNVSVSLISCLLLLFTNYCYYLSNGVIKQHALNQSFSDSKDDFAVRLHLRKSPACVFDEVMLFTCKTARCHRPRVTAVSHYSHDASVGKSMRGWGLSLNCGSVLCQQHTSHAASHHCVCCFKTGLSPSELSPLWCSRRRVPRCKWNSRAINIDPTNVTKHRPKFARTPLTLLTKGA